MQTIRSALNRAMEDRDSYADAYGRQGPEAEEALKLVREYEALHVKVFGEPSFRQSEIERLKTIPTKTIQEISREKEERRD